MDLDLNLVADLDEKLDQYEKEKCKLEKLIASRQLELTKLQNLLEIITNSVAAQRKVLDVVKCKKCTELQQPKQEAATAADVASKTDVLSENVNEILRLARKTVEPPPPTQLTPAQPKPSEQHHQQQGQLSSGIWKSPTKKKQAELPLPRLLTSLPPPPLPRQHARSSAIVRIQSVLKLCNKRSEPKKICQSYPNRRRPYGDNDDIGKEDAAATSRSKLVSLHRTETVDEVCDFAAVSEWKVTAEQRPNRRLEKIIHKRNEDKLASLSRMTTSKSSDFMLDQNRVANLKLLMNYDFCNNSRRRVNKQRVSKSTKKVESEKSSNDLLFELCNLETSIKTSLSKESKEKIDDEEETDLYGDLKAPPNINFDDLLEDGEISDTDNDVKDDKETVLGETTKINKIKDDENVASKKAKLTVSETSTETAVKPVTIGKKNEQSKENNKNSSSQARTHIHNSHNSSRPSSSSMNRNYETTSSSSRKDRDHRERHRRSRSRSTSRHHGRMKSRSRSRSPRSRHNSTSKRDSHKRKRSG